MHSNLIDNRPNLSWMYSPQHPTYGEYQLVTLYNGQAQTCYFCWQAKSWEVGHVSQSCPSHEDQSVKFICFHLINNKSWMCKMDPQLVRDNKKVLLVNCCTSPVLDRSMFLQLQDEFFCKCSTSHQKHMIEMLSVSIDKYIYSVATALLNTKLLKSCSSPRYWVISAG